MSCKIIRRYVLFFLFLTIAGCAKREKTDGRDLTFDADSLKRNRLAVQESMIIGKSIEGLSSVLGDTVQIANSVLLLYTGFDCGSCVDSGFKIVNALERTNEKTIRVVECQANKGTDQLRYGYTKYIFSDQKDVIRRSLKFVKTPILLLFDNNEAIKSVYYPEAQVVVTDQLVNDLLTI